MGSQSHRGAFLRDEWRFPAVGVFSKANDISARAVVTGDKQKAFRMAAKASKDFNSTRMSFKPIEGIRALSCVAILVAHCVYWMSLEAEDKAALYGQYAAHRWMNLVLHIAEPAMDTFLVLTG